MAAECSETPARGIIHAPREWVAFHDVELKDRSPDLVVFNVRWIGYSDILSASGECFAGNAGAGVVIQCG